MSNIIKSSFVCVNPSEKKVIATKDENSMNSQPIKQPLEKKNIVTKDLNQALKDKERMLRDEEANLKVKYQQVMEDANLQAEEIIQSAKEQYDTIKNEAIDEGRKQGYELGKSEAEAEINALKEQLNTKLNTLEDEFIEKQRKFERELIDIMVNVMNKMFGIVIDDKKDIIFHIVNRTIAEAEKSNNYTIRVSREDYELVSNKKQLLYDYVSENANIEIVESDNLAHNKCLIETDNSVIDCSVDTQIKNLITDLQLLSKI